MVTLSTRLLRVIYLTVPSLVVVCVLCSILWSASFLLLLRADDAADLNTVAFRIMSRETFRLSSISTLSALVERLEEQAVCVPPGVRAAVIIRLRLFEDAVNASRVQEIDERKRALRASIQRALKCTPTDSFLWFLQYWTGVSQAGSVTDHLEELRMSYLLGPFEGWIAVRRNAFVLAVHEALPADLVEYAVAEYAALVDAGFTAQAVQNLKGPGWDLRDLLLPRLKVARLESRVALNKALRGEGIYVDIPDVERGEFRPWWR
jgi:hypothetical protein